MTSALHYPFEKIPEHIQGLLIKEAQELAMETYNTTEIYPCGNRKSFDEYFTIYDGMIIFWFDIQIDCGRTTGITTYPKMHGKGVLMTSFLF